jgi:FAD-dependent urate hydroxylase
MGAVGVGRKESSCQVAIIGAGPYGLATAAHLRARSIETRIFGEPMEFWERHMPKGMYLRSASSASSLGDPTGRLGLDRFRNLHYLPITRPVPIADFIRYGHWFQQQAVPHVERRTVADVSTNARGFHVRLDDGEQLHARRVVVATGISPFAHRPTEFAELPRTLVSHSFDHADLGRFAGHKVLVLGGGQSALESAALLQEAGSDVEVLARAPGTYMIPDLRSQGLTPSLRRVVSRFVRPPFDIMGPRFVSWLIAWPRMYRHAPRALQDLLTARSVRPAGASWLVDRLQPVRLTTGTRIVSATPTGNGSRLALRLSDGTERVVDQLLCGTGYRVDVRRYPFLAPPLREAVRTDEGYPQLSPGFESSVPGLHFLGTPAARSFGPLCRFVAGTPYMSREFARFITRRNGKAFA